MVTTSLILKFREIETYLNNCFVEREEVINGALCALLSKSDLVLLGPPGTAKSALTRALCSTVEGAAYFEWLMTKFSTPEELFGPLSLKGLENDQYKRITTGKLPESNIAFVDEVFKANSAILNALLTIMNERLFHNNGSPVKVPLVSIFGASNELPESDELSALYDRFMLRFTVGYVSEDAALEKMLKYSMTTTAPVLTMQELEEAQFCCSNVKVPDEMIAALINIRTSLKREGIYPSDRRLRKTIPIMQAHAWLRGAVKIDMIDLVFLQNCFWDNPNDHKTVKKILKMAANPLLAEFTELSETAEDVYLKAMDEIRAAPDNNAKVTVGIESTSKLKNVAEKMRAIMATASAGGVSVEELNTIYSRVDSLYTDLVKESLGISMTMAK